jgi:hypothetical protein
MEYYSEQYNKNLLGILFKKNLWKSVPLIFLFSMALVCEFNNPNRKRGSHTMIHNIITGIQYFGLNQLLLSFAIACLSILSLYSLVYFIHKNKKMIVGINIDEVNNLIRIYTKDWLNKINQSEVKLGSLKIVKEEKQNDYFLNNSCDCYSFKSNKEIIGRYYVNNFTWLDETPISEIHAAIQKAKYRK